MHFEEIKFSINNWLLFLGFAFLYAIMSVAVSHNCFFWDTVQLGSKHAHYFYEQHFYALLLEDGIDSGHIPVFGAYIGLCWTLFGKSLPVSHLCMLPFLFGIAYESILLLKKIIPPSYLMVSTIVVLMEPTLVTQCTLVSPDIVLIFAMLFSINAALERKKLRLSIGILLLMLISMRGVMVSAAIFLFQIIWAYDKSNKIGLGKEIFNLLQIYLPGIVMFSGYQFYHFYHKGWVFYHDSSPWAPSFEKADLAGILKNLFFLCHRLFDFGRVFVCGAILFLAFKYRSIVTKDFNFRLLFSLFIVMLVFLSYSFLFYKGLTGHRYLLPVYCIMLIMAVYLITQFAHNKKFWFLTCILALMAGHFWVYPTSIAQGWDSSLAHYPYFKLRNTMNQYMIKHKIPMNEVIAAFPNLASQEEIELNGLMTRHTEIESVGSKSYLLYSNVYNEMNNDSRFTKLIEHSTLVYSIQTNTVNMALYKINY
jgi:hypothetical protein